MKIMLIGQIRINSLEKVFTKLKQITVGLHGTLGAESVVCIYLDRFSR